MPDGKDDKQKKKKPGEESKPNDKEKGSDEARQDDKKKKDDKEGRSPEGREGAGKQKSLRFQLPSKHAISSESFSSALSTEIKDDEEDYEDFSTPQTSILQTFVASPLTHSQPRKVSKKTCIVRLQEATLMSSSSSQLFEIPVTNVTSQSDADFNLIKATYLRKLDAVKEAISDGANINACSDQQTPLLIATEVGDTRMVAYLLTVPNVNPDFRNYFGQTPLIVAVRNAFDKIVRLLLNHKADVNMGDQMGKTPLHGAVFQQRPKLAKLLIEHGANVNQGDCFGERPIYTCTVKKPDMECLLTLLKMGATVNHINMTGIPLLSRVILNGTNEAMVKTLVHHGASVNARDLISKKTPLHYAALQDKLNLVKFLISQGADVNMQTTYRFTPLEEAVFQNSQQTAEYLLELMNVSRKELKIRCLM